MPADSGRLKKDRVDVFLRGVSEKTVRSRNWLRTGRSSGSLE